MRHKGVEPVLVLHVEAVAPKPCEEPEGSTKNRNRCGTSRCRFVGTYRCLNLREPFDCVAASRHVDKHGAYQVAHRRPTARPAAGNRHGNGYRID
jgi:hypothetical protein